MRFFFSCDACSVTYEMPVNAPGRCDRRSCDTRSHRRENIVPRYDSSTQTQSLVSIGQSGLLNLEFLARLPAEARFLIVQCLGFSDLARLAVLSKSTLNILRPILQGLIMARGVSAIASSSALADALVSSSRGASQAFLAFDQVDFNRLNRLITLPKSHSIAWGSRGEGDKRGLSQRQVLPGSGGKMHNKFAVFKLPNGNYVTFTGSPNISAGALLGSNIESALIIDGPQVGFLFKEYHRLLTAKPGKGDILLFSRRVAALNESHGPARMAFAPYQNVASFVADEIAGADSVLVRMFLISPKYKLAKSGGGEGSQEYDEPFLNALVELANAGKSVCVVLDDGNYRNTQGMTGFVGDAAKYVNAFAPSVEFHTETGYYVKKLDSYAIMHDKLILVRKGTKYTVLLGSSGMTTNNYDQNNYENMIAFDGKHIYDYFLQLHDAREEDRAPAQIPENYSKKWKK